MKIREYQQQAVDAVYKEWSEGCNSTLIVCPTGSGKTVIIANVIKGLKPRRCIVIAHRQELLFQAREKIAYATGIECEIEMADMVASTSFWNKAPCIVASVQTLVSGPKENRRMRRFNPKDFAAVIVDEAHHMTADSYLEIWKYFSEGNPDIKLLGVTATPDRTDEEALGQVFKSVAFDYEILDAIHDGWLVPVEQQMVKTTIDWAGIRTTCGDLNGADLAAVMEAEDALHGVAGATIEIAGNRRTLVFAASVKQAEMLCNIFNRHKPGCSEWVCGATPRDQRKNLLDRFHDGETQIMVNCAVLTEGFDSPGVEVIVMGRPTKSRALYAQCCGRALRPLDGITNNLETADERKAAIASSPKPSALIIDFVGNSGKHKLMTTADILGGKVSEEACEKAVERAKKEGGPVNMQMLLDEEEKKLRELAEARRLAEEARKNKVVAKVSFRSSFVNPFDILDISPARDRGWDNGRTLSEKQRQFLAKQGVDSTAIPYSQGRQLINELFRRFRGDKATLKQCAVVKRHWPEVNVKDLTREQASGFINQLAANGWKRPQPKVAA